MSVASGYFLLGFVWVIPVTFPLNWLMIAAHCFARFKFVLARRVLHRAFLEAIVGPSPPPARMNHELHHRIASGRATLAAEVVGSGDPIVFLHAAVCDSRMWRAQLDGVRAGNKAIAYDRRGFGETHAEKEDFSAVADLMAVIDAMANGRPAILVGCSQGGGIALDAALRHPSSIRALVLIAPNVTGAPEPIYPPEIKGVMLQLKEAQEAGDLDRVNAIKARLWLDGPLAPEDRVTGPARRLFHDMHAIALRSPPTGANLDVAPAFDRLGEISAPSLVIWGDLDFPFVQERCRHIARTVLNASAHELTGAAHLPSLWSDRLISPACSASSSIAARATGDSAVPRRPRRGTDQMKAPGQGVRFSAIIRSPNIRDNRGPPVPDGPEAQRTSLRLRFASVAGRKHEGYGAATILKVIQ